MKEYRRWEDNIKMDLKEIRVGMMYWMDLAPGLHLLVEQ